jgi:WD40 repeat protein
MSYKAFISYSHAADGQLAPTLQSALQRFARPFYRLRALRIFRDETSLRLTPKLWPMIQQALSESEYFLLLASPTAAESKWVQDEVYEWLRLQRGSSDKFLIVLTEGEIAWDTAGRDFDWVKTTALPSNLQGKFQSEPLFLDFRWARESKQLSLRNPQFLRAVGKLAATLHNKPLDAIIGEDVQQHRVFKRVASLVIVLLLALTGVATFAAYYANTQRKRAEEQTRIAEERARLAMARQLAVQAMRSSEETVTSSALGSYSPERGVLLALESLNKFQTSDGMLALHGAIVKLTGQASEIDFKSEINGLAFSAKDEQTGVVQDGKALVWEAKKSQASAWKVPVEGVAALVFSEDGKQLATVGVEEGYIWDAAAREQKGRLPPVAGEEKVAFNSDGTRWLSLDKRRLQVWDIASSRLINEIKPPAGSWLAVALSPGGLWLATLEQSNFMQVIEVATGREVSRSRDKDDDVANLALSSDGKLIAISGMEEVEVFEVNGWNKIATLAHEWVVGGMTFSSDGRWLTTVTTQPSLDAADLSETALVGSTIRVWNLDTKSLVLQVSLAKEGGIKQTFFTPDGRWLVSAGPIITPAGDGSVEHEGSRLRIWMLLPDDLRKRACSVLKRNLSDSEWKTYIGHEPYRQTCEGLPIPQE